MSAFTLGLLGGGKLGTVIRDAARQREIPCAVVSGEPLRHTETPATLKVLRDRQPRAVLLDASSGTAVLAHLAWAKELGFPFVIGATGHGLDRAAVEDLSEGKIGVLIAPNFAPGALLLGRIAEAVGGWCGRASFAPFLEERHHVAKKDAPSGTALWLASRVKSSGGPELPTTATRAGQLAGSHLLGLSGPGELVELRHSALTREAYGAGALEACSFLLNKKGVFGLEDWARELFPWPSARGSQEEI